MGGRQTLGKRWYKRAIQKSAQQLVGAERWIRQHPDRVFLDAACQRAIPIRIPYPGRLNCHLVLVAHGADSACRAAVDKNRRLAIDPEVVGDGSPFVIGQILPSGPTVHVLDDVSLPIVLDTLDTVADFVGYLARKEALLVDKRLEFARDSDSRFRLQKVT